MRSGCDLPVMRSPANEGHGAGSDVQLPSNAVEVRGSEWNEGSGDWIEVKRGEFQVREREPAMLKAMPPAIRTMLMTGETRSL